MKSIADELYIEKSIADSIKSFFRRFQVGATLKSSNAYKSKGIAVASIITYLLNLVFMQKTMYRDMVDEKGSIIRSSKDAVYRFLRSTSINWVNFLLQIAGRVISWLHLLTSEERLNAMILDDTVLERPYSKSTELVAKIYDHVDHAFKTGFSTLFLGWTDGFSFIPLAFRHMSSKKKSLRLSEAREDTDMRTNGGKAKKEATMSKLDVALRMLRDAKRFAIPAKYVLFDSWFTSPTFVMKVLEIGYHVVGRLKNGSTKYCVNGEWQDLLTIYWTFPKKQRRRNDKFLFSVPVLMKNDTGKTAEARIIYVKNKANPTQWVAFLCTDMSLSEQDIIALYGRRWKIEEFFKICKSYLRFTGEFRQTSYEALTAHTSIVSLRYMILAVEQRQKSDMRNEPGDIFFLFCDEVKDIKYEEAIDLIFVLMYKFKNFLVNDVGVNEEQLEKFAKIFLETLPREIQLKLAQKLPSKAS
jgi:hypothetical protein